MTSTPSLRKTSSNARLNLASSSRSRKRGGGSLSESFQTRFRACCATQVASGFSVIPARCTRRLESSMMKST
jgi:hypothetical protein